MEANMPLRTATVAGFTLFTLLITFLNPFAFFIDGEGMGTLVIPALLFIGKPGFFFIGALRFLWVENRCWINLPNAPIPLSAKYASLGSA